MIVRSKKTNQKTDDGLKARIKRNGVGTLMTSMGAVAAFAAVIGVVATAQTFDPKDIVEQAQAMSQDADIDSDTEDTVVGTDADYQAPVNDKGEEVTLQTLQLYKDDKAARKEGYADAADKAAKEAEAARKAEEERIAAEQAAAAEAARQAEQQSYDYGDGYYGDSSSYSGGGGGYSGYSGGLNTSSGVNYYNGQRETYYTEAENTGYFWINGGGFGDDGVYRDADGYVVVASQDYSKGTVIDTSLGTAKVYDYCGVPGTVDVYTNW